MPQPHGLENLGNTCYMNSGIQLLIHSKYIAQYIEKNKEAGPFTNAGYQLAMQMCGPQTIKELMGQQYDMFNNYEQQDSHEFIMLYLDQLDNEQKEPECKLSRYMEFEIEEGISCKLCHTMSTRVTKDSQIMIDLSFLNQEQEESAGDAATSPPVKVCRSSTLRECLQRHYQPYSLNVYCSKCQESTEHTITSRIKSFPRQLFLVFKRFDQNNQKLQNQVEFYPSLDMRDYASDAEQNAQYNLDAVSLHAGCTQGGHYTTYVISDGQQYCCDDTLVRECSIDFKSLKAYVLSYSLNSGEHG